MSTRAVIARRTGPGTFEGVYHHFDGYPAGLGAVLFDHAKEHGIKVTTKKAIDQAKHGWSSFPDKKYNDGDMKLTHQDASASGCEWAYAFDQEKNEMLVLSSFCEDGAKMIGMFGSGDPNASWRIAAVVDLSKPEPDWDEME